MIELHIALQWLFNKTIKEHLMDFLLILSIVLILVSSFVRGAYKFYRSLPVGYSPPIWIINNSFLLKVRLLIIISGLIGFGMFIDIYGFSRTLLLLFVYIFSAKMWTPILRVIYRGF